MDSLFTALVALAPRGDGGSRNGTLNAGPPEVRSRKANHSTLLVSWWCTGFALVIILVRLWGRYERSRVFFKEDKIMALSIIPLLIRMGLAHPILLFGTNNINTVGVELGAQQIHLHSVGARLVLVSRIFYALFIWTAKFTVSEYLKRLVASIWTERYQLVLRAIRIFLVVTFFSVVIATLSECQPFSHYWQVVPDPGPRCRNGYAQMMTMGLCDILTDVLLIGFPIHLIWKSTMPTKRRLTLTVLFSLSLILIAITSYRMFAIIDANGRQQLRTLWASLEILAAAAVSNALVLGSFLRDKGVKRAKYRGPQRSRSESTTVAEPSINRVMTQQHWGNDSDEDLFRCVRGRLGSVAETASSTSKVPPMPSQRFARAGSDIESHVVEEEHEDEGTWTSDSSKEKYIITQESSSVATSWASDQNAVQSDRSQTPSTMAHDFAVWGNGFTDQQGHRTSHSTDLADAGGLLHYSPPPTAQAASQQRRDSTNDLARAGSSSSSTHFAFHTPNRGPRFTVSPSQPDATSASEVMPPISRTDTTTSSTPTLQDAGGLLGAPHVSQPRQTAPPSGRRNRSQLDSHMEDVEEPPEHSRRRFLGLGGAWRRPSDKSDATQSTPRAKPSEGASQTIDPMDLQDAGGLLGSGKG